MSLIPSLFGRRSNVSRSSHLNFGTRSRLPKWTFTSSNLRSRHRMGNATERTPDHVFQADLPGLKRERVKWSLEEGRVLADAERAEREQERRTTVDRVRGQRINSLGDPVARERQ
ncbi:LOW QUALITY PROTEIN: heat shock protein 17.4-like protein [Cinnamomum micranthum f. kanehirae]|uniref:Heat shock protein 17.4-like protein n=1 Tax=Cinnamomum micranthum f. kanehirae TaxID=337451 RepID=A0A443Q5F3_9MAGN|nr:LOW QUALITY PROTEIN: heat shock protein 17.4-like protein [Cinnamomum micranthum f. kanehirae]